MKGNPMFNNWAQPVKSKPWAAITTVLYTVSRLSGYRILNTAKAKAWERATIRPRSAAYKAWVESRQRPA